MNTLSTVVLVLAVVSKTYAANVPGSNIVQKTSDSISTASENVQQQADDTVNHAFDFLQSSNIQSMEDVRSMVSQLKNVIDNLYGIEMKNLQTWTQNNELAQYLPAAQENLTLARNQLKDISQSIGDEALERIEQAQKTMDPSQLGQVYEEVQQRIRSQMHKPLYYFQKAAKTIGDLANINGQENLTENLPGMNGNSVRSTGVSLPQMSQMPQMPQMPQVPQVPQISGVNNLF